MSLRRLRRDLKSFANPARATINQSYFKTGPGEYGEGDRFLGLSTPIVRRLAREYEALSFLDLAALLRSPWHEERVLGLVILVRRYHRGSSRERDMIHRFYMRHRAHVDNWDLVDCSAPILVGAHLEHRSRALLAELARSRRVWDRRIAIIATYHYIKDNDFRDTLKIVGRLLGDPHDLIHKAAGWMLREVANRDRRAAERFLRRHASRMPRTMLRYAIERFPPSLRRRYLLAGIAPAPRLTRRRSTHRRIDPKHALGGTGDRGQRRNHHDNRDAGERLR